MQLFCQDYSTLPCTAPTSIRRNLLLSLLCKLVPLVFLYLRQILKLRHTLYRGISYTALQNGLSTAKTLSWVSHTYLWCTNFLATPRGFCLALLAHITSWGGGGGGYIVVSLRCFATSYLHLSA